MRRVLLLGTNVARNSIPPFLIPRLNRSNTTKSPLLALSRPIHTPTSHSKKILQCEARADSQKIYKEIRRLIRVKERDKALYEARRALLQVNRDQRLTEADILVFNEKLISLFLFDKQWLGANKLYTLMKEEGFVVSPRIVNLLMLKSRYQSTKVNSVEQIIQDASSTINQLTESHLDAVLQHLNNKRVHPNRLLQLVRKFATSKDEGWTPSPRICAQLVKAHARQGLWQMALHWLQVGKGGLSNDGEDRQRMMRTLYENWFASGRPILRMETRAGTMLKRMAADGVKPTPKIYNSLMEAYGREGRAAKSYVYYGRIPRDERDRQTYSTMFKSLSAATISKHRRKLFMHGRHVRIWRGPILPVICGRRVFRDLTEHHHRKTMHSLRRTPFLCDYVLNTALRYFMSKNDYAAASVTVQSFSAFSIRHTPDTFRHVLMGLVIRLTKELKNLPRVRPEGLVLWADRILGRLQVLFNGWQQALPRDLLNLAWEDTLRVLDPKKQNTSPRLSSGRTVYSELYLMLSLLRRALLAKMDIIPGQQTLTIENAKYNGAMEVARRHMLPPEYSDRFVSIP